MSIDLKVRNTSDNPLPKYQTAFSAGMDLMANLEGNVVITPGHRVLVGTGLFIELPQGYEAQIRPRSGLALKHGITILNSPGTIDADYRGEIKVLLINHGEHPFQVEHGDRIAQMIVSKHASVQWMESEELSQTERGTGGYGHTGL